MSIGKSCPTLSLQETPNCIGIKIFPPVSTQSFWELGRAGERGSMGQFECHKIGGVALAFTAQGCSQVLNAGVIPIKRRINLSTISVVSSPKNWQVMWSGRGTPATNCWDWTLYFQSWPLSLKTKNYIPTDWLTSSTGHSMGMPQCTNPNQIQYLLSPHPLKET